MKAIKGNIVYTKTKDKFELIENGYIIVDDNGKVEGCYPKLPQKYENLPLVDYMDKIIIPAFTDLHVHASQLPIPGILYNTELIEWLNNLTIPQEIRLHDIEYAKKIYKKFVKKLIQNGIAHSVIMTTIHTDSATVLFDELVASGLKAYVGKVSEDCNTLSGAMEESTAAIRESERFIIENIGKSERVKPTVTPTISMICSREVMRELAKQSEQYQIPVQAHLSENREEVDFTLKMYPDCNDFLETYEKAGLMKNDKCIAAHSIHLTENEKHRIKKKGIFVAHCPHSNLNLLSGMMNLAEYLDAGIRVGLGSDVSGGHTLNPFSNMVAAIQTGATLYLSGKATRPISAAEVFYCATKGGGSFFGKTGSFEKGYDFDALIIDDVEMTEFNQFSLAERAEKIIYCSDDRNITGMYVNGEEILKK